MKFWKHSLITVFAFLAIASTVFINACISDSCQRLICRNKGTCVDGFCKCPSGYEGARCETSVVVKFTGYYYGFTKCDMNPPVIDSAYVFAVGTPTGIAGHIFTSSGDTVRGEVIGSTLVSDQTSSGGNLANIKIENGKLNFYIQKNINGETQICTFQGDHVK
jgi:hypothetical protein